jgi:hypothetical protein
MAAEESTGELGKRLVAWQPLRDRCARGELGVGLIFAATGSAANHGFELGEDREHRERDSLRAQARAFEACGEFAASERLSIQRALEDVRRACAHRPVQSEPATVVRDRPMHSRRG